MKKAPIPRGLVSETFVPIGTPRLLLLLRGCFFLRSSFLGCVLHRLILPKHQNFAIRKSQCDSYIRLFEKNVKEKMHGGALHSIMIACMISFAVAGVVLPLAIIHAALAAGSVPTANEIVARSIDANDRNTERSREYVFGTRLEKRELD